MKKLKMIINMLGGEQKLEMMRQSGYQCIEARVVGPYDTEFTFIKTK